MEKRRRHAIPLHTNLDKESQEKEIQRIKTNIATTANPKSVWVIQYKVRQDKMSVFRGMTMKLFC